MLIERARGVTFLLQHTTTEMMVGRVADISSRDGIPLPRSHTLIPAPACPLLVLLYRNALTSPRSPSPSPSTDYRALGTFNRGVARTVHHIHHVSIPRRPPPYVMTTPQPSSGQRQGRLTLRELQAGRCMAEESYRECLEVKDRWIRLGETETGQVPTVMLPAETAAMLRAKEAMLPEVERKVAAACDLLRRFMPDDRAKVRISYIVWPISLLGLELATYHGRSSHCLLHRITQLADALGIGAMAYGDLKWNAQAVSKCQEAYALVKRCTTAEEERVYIRTCLGLGTNLRLAGRYEEAATLFTEYLASTKKRGEPPLFVLHWLTDMLLVTGKWAEALEYGLRAERGLKRGRASLDEISETYRLLARTRGSVWRTNATAAATLPSRRGTRAITSTSLPRSAAWSATLSGACARAGTQRPRPPRPRC